MKKPTSRLHDKRRLPFGGRRFLILALTFTPLLASWMSAHAQPPQRDGQPPRREIRGGRQEGVPTDEAKRDPVEDLKLLNQLSTANPLPEGLSEKPMEALKKVSQFLSEGNSEDARAEWKNFLGMFEKPPDTETISTYVNYLGHELLQHESPELVLALRKVNANKTAASEIQTHAREKLRKTLAELEPGKTTTVEIPKIDISPDGTLKIEMESAPAVNAEQIEAIVARLEEQAKELNAGETALQADLQNALEANEPQILRVQTAVKMLRSAVTPTKPKTKN